MVAYSRVLLEAEQRATLPSFRSTELFGGAISADLPAGFLDASQFREVPDHQEVFVSEDSSESKDESTIIELVERLESNSTETIADSDPTEADKSAVLAHYEEIASINTDIAKPRIFGVYPVDVNSSLPESATAYMVVGTMIGEKWGLNRASSTTHLVMILGVIRLPSSGTDVLITFNSATLATQNSISEFVDETKDLPSDILNRMASIQAICRHTLSSFQVHNWDLFCD
ncbi:hypothetical protein V1511DRAFT_375961 [Dipodascopsis uninucleata]